MQWGRYVLKQEIARSSESSHLLKLDSETQKCSKQHTDLGRPLVFYQPKKWELMHWIEATNRENQVRNQNLSLESPWNPKANHFINRCLVISNHFLCKDWESSNWNNHL